MPPTCLPERGSFAHLQFKFTKVQIPSPITGLRDDLISTTFEAGRFQGTRKARKKERKKERKKQGPYFSLSLWRP